VSNPSKRKGTTGENAIVTWLLQWFKGAERRALRGINDAGDISGTPYVHSVKRCESWPIHKWLEELDTQRRNAGGHFGWISAKRSRRPWVHIVPHDVMTHLLDAAYGRPEEEKGSGPLVSRTRDFPSWTTDDIPPR